MQVTGFLVEKLVGGWKDWVTCRLANQQDGKRVRSLLFDNPRNNSRWQATSFPTHKEAYNAIRRTRYWEDAGNIHFVAYRIRVLVTPTTKP